MILSHLSPTPFTHLSQDQNITKDFVHGNRYLLIKKKEKANRTFNQISKNQTNQDIYMDIDIIPVNARPRAGNPQSMQKQRRMSGLMTRQENSKYEFNAPRYEKGMMFEDDQTIDNDVNEEINHNTVTATSVVSANPRINNRMSFGMSKLSNIDENMKPLHRED